MYTAQTILFVHNDGAPGQNEDAFAPSTQTLKDFDNVIYIICSTNPVFSVSALIIEQDTLGISHHFVLGYSIGYNHDFVPVDAV